MWLTVLFDQKKAMSQQQSPVISEEPLLEPGLVTELVDNEVVEVKEVTTISTPVYSVIYYNYYPSNTQRYVY